jgi:N-acetyl-anhydromuramyl-L-alanine amidase AmpD/peptidoglycan/xylan/chitin deacetylase (PgdA/CDA1 family)
LLRKIIYILIILTVLSGCSTPTATATPTLPAIETKPPAPTETPVPTVTQNPTAVPTLAPTATLAPTFIPTSRIPIIEYHDPEFNMSAQVQMQLSWFEDQMSWLAAKGYRTLSAEELVAYLDGETSFPQKSVVITFDIGTAKRPNYNDVVIPTLQKYGFKAIFFILNNNTVVHDECKGDKYFCWDDFKKWAGEGLISIASHGLFHPDFKTLTPLQIKYEAEESRKELLDKTGQVALGFAFPFDSIPSDAGVNMVKAAGYDFAVAGPTRRDLVVQPKDPDRYHLPRVYPYSNPNIYPMLEGYNRSFADEITSLVQPVASPTQPARTSSPAPTGSSAVPPSPTGSLQPTVSSEVDNIHQVLQICQGLPSSLTERQLALSKAHFDPDVSPEAQAKLPGFTTSPSCNFFGGDQPEAIVLHYTVGDLNSSLAAFRQDNGAASHYIIDRDGKIVQLVPEGLAALHANCNGQRKNCLPSCPICDGRDGTLTEPYTRSIGIELVNRGHIPGPTAPGTYFEDYLRSFSNYSYWEEFTDAQIASLKILVEDIASRWNIPIDANHVIGHYRVNYKVDPGPALNLFWSRAGSPPRDPIFPTPTVIP